MYKSRNFKSTKILKHIPCMNTLSFDIFIRSFTLEFSFLVNESILLDYTFFCPSIERERERRRILFCENKIFYFNTFLDI